MNEHDTSHDESRRHFISTPVKLFPAVALAGATGFAAPSAFAQAAPAAQNAQASSTVQGQIRTSNQMKKIFVIATGGTIAGTASSQTEVVSYTAAQRTVNDLLAGIPRPENREFEGYQLAQVDSKDMSFEVWRNLVLKVQEVLARPDIAGIVITHGTDTLEETSYFLHLAVNATKPIVFTAAMRPSTALSADGPANLLDSITLAGVDNAQGVMCVLDGRIYGAEDIRKRHTYRIEAFQAGEAGPIGAVEGGIVRQWRNWPVSQPIVQASQLPEDTAKWPWVEIVESCAGTTGAIVPALVGAGVNGLVIAATGNGTIHKDLIAHAKEAMAQGIPVVRAARVGDGVILGEDEDGIAKSACTLPVKARVLMIAQLLRG